MPRGKGTARRGKAKGKAAAKTEELDTSQEEEASQPTSEAEPTEAKAEEKMQEEEPVTTEESADDEPVTNGQVKRKAEEDAAGDMDENEAKKAKTDDEEDAGPKSITLFCGNLNAELTAETLKTFFESNDITVTDARKFERKRFGYVDIPEAELDDALKVSGKMLNGDAIRVDVSKPKGEAPEKFTNTGDDLTMFVKNLTAEVTEDDLMEFFKDEGEITEIRLPKRRDGMAKGFGYIVFDTEETLAKAIEAKQGAEFKGEKLFLDYTNAKSEFKPRDKRGVTQEFGPSKVLFVRNLSFQVTEDELKEIFDGCVACRIPPNEWGQPKGFAFIEFTSVEEAETAQKDKDGLEINGRVVQLAFASDKPTVGGTIPGMAGRRGGGGGWGHRGGNRGHYGYHDGGYGGVIGIVRLPAYNTEVPVNQATKLFVRNVSFNATEADLRDVFWGCTACRIPVDNVGKPKGFAFVEYDTEEEAQRAIRQLDGIQIKGRNVQLALEGASDRRRQGLCGRPSRKLFLRNVSFHTTIEELNEMFEGCVAARIPVNEYEEPKGFAFVEYKTTEEAVAAQKAKNGIQIHGRTVQIAFETDSGAQFLCQRPSKKLFVRNLSFQATEDDVRAVFDDCVTCRIPINDFGLPKGFAFVEYNNVEDAERALKEKNGVEVCGRTIQLAYETESAGVAPGMCGRPSKKVFVRNLSFQATEEDLRSVFEHAIAVRIPVNDQGKPKGFAFVEFNSVEEAQMAQRNNNGVQICGRNVDLAFETDGKQGGGGGPPGRKGGAGMFGAGGGLGPQGGAGFGAQGVGAFAALGALAGLLGAAQNFGGGGGFGTGNKGQGMGGGGGFGGGNKGQGGSGGGGFGGGGRGGFGGGNMGGGGYGGGNKGGGGGGYGGGGNMGGGYGGGNKGGGVGGGYGGGGFGAGGGGGGGWGAAAGGGYGGGYGGGGKGGAGGYGGGNKGGGAGGYGGGNTGGGFGGGYGTGGGGSGDGAWGGGYNNNNNSGGGGYSGGYGGGYGGGSGGGYGGGGWGGNSGGGGGYPGNNSGGGGGYGGNRGGGAGNRGNRGGGAGAGGSGGGGQKKW